MPGCLCGVQLGIFYLHTSVLLLLILKPVNRLLSHLVSCSLLASSLFLEAGHLRNEDTGGKKNER